MYAIAVYLFPFIAIFVIDHGSSRKRAGGTELTTVRNLPKFIAKYQPKNVVTSKTAAKDIVSRCIQLCMHSFAKNVYEFLHGVVGEKNEVPNRLRALDKYDILGLVFQPRSEAWCNEEVVGPNALLLATSFKAIDPHYQYTQKTINVSIEEEEEEGGTYGEFLEEQAARVARTEFDTAGLAMDCRVGLRWHFCCGCPISKPRPVLDFSSKNHRSFFSKNIKN